MSQPVKERIYHVEQAFHKVSTMMDNGQPIECSGDMMGNTMENKRWYFAEEQQIYEKIMGLYMLTYVILWASIEQDEWAMALSVSIILK